MQTHEDQTIHNFMMNYLRKKSRKYINFLELNEKKKHNTTKTLRQNVSFNSRVLEAANNALPLYLGNIFAFWGLGWRHINRSWRHITIVSFSYNKKLYMKL